MRESPVGALWKVVVSLFQRYCPCVQLQLRLISEEKVSSKCKGGNLLISASLATSIEMCDCRYMQQMGSQSKIPLLNSSLSWSPGSVCLKKSESHRLCQLCQIWQQIQTLAEKTWICSSSDGTFLECAKWLTGQDWDLEPSGGPGSTQMLAGAIRKQFHCICFYLPMVTNS